MHTVHNARITLLAMAFNNLGVGANLTGIVAPMVSHAGFNLANLVKFFVLR